MPENRTILGGVVSRWAITIPANTGNGATVQALAEAAGYSRGNFTAFRICAKLPDGTDRGAFVVATTRPGAAAVATDFTTHGQHVAAGNEYQSEPSELDRSSLLRSTTGSTVTAILVVMT